MTGDLTTVVLATGNPGKLRELQSLLSGLPVEVVAQSNFEIEPAVESGLSFVENALIKARHASMHTGLPAIADDSGLAVDALGGAPGIYSSRYAGEQASDTDNVVKLLNSMKDLDDAHRVARFHCVAVWVSHAQDPVPIVCQGAWEGRIARHASGDGGFGYDPVFQLADGRTAAQLVSEEKNRISHRAQAMRCLVSALEARLGG
ncbi:MAG: RdgB/HAM1 family non-canonical purine NTP pyrophosphatase [Gammaproteobacteria bacterium]|nr:RdgB/HAM1 family non-canonical purine NTP pyrophosphatase [Gammaproteobacteria bacterium]